MGSTCGGSSWSVDALLFVHFRGAHLSLQLKDLLDERCLERTFNHGVTTDVLDTADFWTIIVLIIFYCTG